MLVNFRVENFKSFKDLTEFSMEATKLKNLKESNTFDINNLSLLTSAVIYGANASGKSSLLEAMQKMKSILKKSINIEESKKYRHQPFLLNSETETKETYFEMEFIIDKVLYRYGFKIALDSTILEEWLFQKKLQPKAREINLFKRDRQLLTLGTQFKEGKDLIDKTRENTLFILIVAQFNGKISQEIIEWFNQFNILSNIKSHEFEGYSLNKLEDEKFKKKIINFIKSSDVGIHNILHKKINLNELKKDLNINQKELESLPKEILSELEEEGLLKVETVHIQYDKDNSFKELKIFDLAFESDGTQKLLALTAPIIDTLIDGKTLLIDELDNSLHTELLKAIVMLFNSKKTNPNNAQLIFTTHDTNLLNQKFFRRDQIWFTEKDIYGATDFYSLLEYGKGKTRDDLVLDKNYLEGKFGAIPHIALNYEVD